MCKSWISKKNTMPPAWPRRSPPTAVPGLRPSGVHNKGCRVDTSINNIFVRRKSNVHLFVTHYNLNSISLFGMIFCYHDVTYKSGLVEVWCSLSIQYTLNHLVTETSCVQQFQLFFMHCIERCSLIKDLKLFQNKVCVNFFLFLVR